LTNTITQDFKSVIRSMIGILTKKNQSKIMVLLTYILLSSTCLSQNTQIGNVESTFKIMTAPLSGEKKYFGMRDLVFFSNPKLLAEPIIKKLDPNGESEYIDSVFNMENGKLVSVNKENTKYYAFYKIELPEKAYFLIYSKNDKEDEYGYNVYLDAFDGKNILKSSILIYSHSDLRSFRNFHLTKDTLTLVDYVSIKSVQTVNNKQKKVFTTNFEVAKYVLDTKTLNFTMVSRRKRNGGQSASRYRDAETYLEEDPLKKLL
jgi:hypothetical protein